MNSQFKFFDLKSIWNFVFKLFNSSTWQLFGLCLLAAWLFLYKLNDTYLTSWDEAWHAVIARNMARSGNFITPIYNGQIWFATAPLYLWILAIWFQLTNFSTLGVRLFSSLSGIGTVFLTYLIGKKLSNHRFGLISAFILTTTIHFLFRARQGNLDAPLAFFNTLAVYSFLQGRTNQHWYYIFGVATACGFLTKSLFGLFPFFLLPFIPKRFIAATVLVFLAVSLPWHLLAFHYHGFAFFNHYFLQYVLSKATHSNPISGTDWLWYLTTLKHGLKIWFLLFIPALLWTLFKFITPPIRTNLIYWPKLTNALPFLWFIIPITLLSFARMRNDWYIISLYPAIALIASFFLTELIQYIKKKFHIKFGLLFIYGLICIAGFTNIWRYRSSFVVPDTTAAEAYLAGRAGELTPPGIPILLDDNYLPVAVFYSDRRVIPLRYSRSFESLVTADVLHQATASGAHYVLTNKDTQRQLLQSLQATQYETIATRDDKLLIKFNY